jgi:membrane protease YdiL (CAAX protease family)
MLDDGGERASVHAGAREALWAGCGLIAFLWIGKHVTAVGGVVATAIYTGIAAYQLYVPLWLIQRRGELPESHAIHVHGALLGPIAALRRMSVLRRRRLRRRGSSASRGSFAGLLAHYGRGASFRGRPFAVDALRAIAVAALTFVPFALGMIALQKYAFQKAYVFTVPPEMAVIVLQNLFLVALPEELFYRGFLQTRLERYAPSETSLLHVPLGKSIVLVAAIFAFGHFAGEYNPARLGPFFPSFLFSMLTKKSNSIFGAILYHGCSNAFSRFLLAGFR